MKLKNVLCLLLVLCLCASFVGCGKDDGVPEGMQLCLGDEEIGYYFYVPKEWTCSNFADRAMAFVSSINATSVSLAPANIPTELSLADYFEESKKEFTYPIQVVLENQPVNLGNASEAAQFLYTFVYNEMNFRVLQVLARFQERSYIFTYTSFDKPYSDDQTVYEYNYDKALRVMENIRFVDRIATEQSTPKRDADGDVLVSDRVICGFDLYMKEGWQCRYSDALVQIATSDGSNLSVVEATNTGVYLNDYWETRKAELSEFVHDLTVIRENEKTDFANAKSGYCYEYRFRYGNATYHVYQVFSVTSMHGYAFTYTAKEENYEKHLPDVLAMAEKLKF